MHSSHAVFDLNNHKSGVNRYLWFCQFPKNSEVCRAGCVLFIKPFHHTLHISELKYAPAHRTFPSFLEIDKSEKCLFTPDLRLFKSHTVRDERISANSQTQH